MKRRRSVSKRVEKLWQEFERSCLLHCPSFQRREMKKAFYAGAGSLLDHLGNNMGEDVSEEEGLEIFQSIRDECEQFFEQVMK